MSRKIKISIEGMHCASCANNVERALKKVKGVESCAVSIMTNKAFVECKDEANVEEMKKAIARVGYRVRNVE